mmetsp:Transcript_76234/g.246876  ORF Transcript_76234/g.246876 Transcript_76234/m.246876 type:complete len:213 (+) Transcript_76234:453-1091(+)
MPNEPATARCARAMVSGDDSGRPGPGPKTTWLGRMASKASSADGPPWPRPSTTSTSAPSKAQAFTMLRLNESRFSTKSTRHAAGPTAGSAWPRDQRRQSPEHCWQPASPLRDASARAARRPSTRSSTGSMVCCASPVLQVPTPTTAAPTPKAVRSNCPAFALASSTSASGSEPMVNPPPALTSASQPASPPPWASRVRMRMFHWQSPLWRST